MSDDSSAPVEFDPAALRDLFVLLSEFNVGAFSGYGIQVAFKDVEHVPLTGRNPEQVVKDEDRSTSSTPVSGFGKSNAQGFRNSKLWIGQAGKVLKLDGSYE